jgi:two-component system, chemotaxis family, sensor kinase Cph1
MSSSLDLSQCDREPIHIPGSIQPHGTLFTIDPASLKVVQFAGVWGEWDSRRQESLAGRDIADLLSPEAVARITAFAAGTAKEPVYLGTFPLGDRTIDITAHYADGLLVIELEPAETVHKSAPELLAAIRAIITDFEAAEDLNALCTIAARTLRDITKFDRVMVYRFHADGVGFVAAEDKREDLPTFLNHHYPASDIPSQARALYIRNRIRTIPDVNYAPAPVIPPSPGDKPQLDMTDCVLRSVSPIHVEYLKNMGVSASSSVSIVIGGQLWGLIAFHHLSPKLLGYELREACKHLGQVLAQHISARSEAEARAQEAALANERDEYAKILVASNDLDQTLLDHCQALLSIVPCNGAAIVCGDRTATGGHAPDASYVQKLARWLIDTDLTGPLATDSLANLPGFPLEPREDAAGLLATVLSSDERVVLMWFRVEQITKINWAGNPHKVAEADPETGRLSPRKSFDVWSQLVRWRAQPWTAAEQDAAKRVCRLVDGLRQQEALRRLVAKNEELLTQKDLLMQEADHRIQNNIQLLYGMLGLQAREIVDEGVRTKIEETQRRLMAVSMIHRRLWRSGGVENVDLAVYLSEFREGLVDAWGSSWAKYLTMDVAPITVPASRAVTLALVINELLTNAAKYAYRGGEGPIDVTIREEDDGVAHVVVTDEGIGLAPSDTLGFGSRLTRSLITQLKGSLEIISNNPGTRVIVKANLFA